MQDMTIHIDSSIIRDAVRDAVSDHLKEHPLSIPATFGASTTPDTQDEGPRFYTRAQAAETAQISLPTLHQLHNEGLVDFVKIGRSTRILADKFDADLAAGRFGRLRNKHRTA